MKKKSDSIHFPKWPIWDKEEIEAVTVNPVPTPNSEVNFEEYWPWLAALALLLIGVEGWLAWRK